MTRTPSDGVRVKITLNGVAEEVDVPPGELLVSTVRERFGCLSVREACGIGICGSCTVLVDGRALSACSTLTHQVDGSALMTSEGLVSPKGEVSRIQQAFIDAAAFQCSFCIPAFVLTLTALLERRPEATYEEACVELEGNLCRCGSYPRIMAAVRGLVADPAGHSSATHGDGTETAGRISDHHHTTKEST